MFSLFVDILLIILLSINVWDIIKRRVYGR